MSALTTLALLAVVLITATISGVFGMVGGLMLMGALTLVMPVSAAMVTHGAVQFVSNGWRAVLHRKHIAWRIILFYGVGSAMSAGLLAPVTYEPTKAWVYLLLGLVPGLAWIPKSRFNLDAATPGHAIACGLSVTGLNVLAGVSGPLLDVFFAAPLAMLGAVLGGRMLDRMNDINFLKWTRWIVTAVGAVYLLQAALLFVS